MRLVLALTIIVDTDCTEPRFTEWREGADGSMGRVCALPDRMTMQEAERIAAERRSVQGNAPGPNRCVPNCVPRQALLWPNTREENFRAKAKPADLAGFSGC
jgi:hypothetical protein